MNKKHIGKFNYKNVNRLVPVVAAVAADSIQPNSIAVVDHIGHAVVVARLVVVAIRPIVVVV